VYTLVCSKPKFGGEQRLEQLKKQDKKIMNISGILSSTWNKLQHHDLLEDKKGGRWRIVYIDGAGLNRPIDVSEDGAMHGRETRVRMIGGQIFVGPGSEKAQTLANGFSVLPRQPVFRGSSPVS